MRNLLLMLALFLSAEKGFTANEIVEIPEEELSQETVLPRFDFPEAVRNRTVNTAKRFELGGYFGWNISEPIWGQGKLGLNVGYHISETSAFILNYAKWLGGLNTQYTDGLEDNTNKLVFSRLPQLLSSMYLHYEWKLFYGKISFTKSLVANNCIYPIFGIGQTQYTHKSYSGIDLGIGQKIYFSNHWGLRADFKFQYSEAPSPFLKDRMAQGNTAPQFGEFKNRYIMNSILDFGFVYLL